MDLFRCALEWVHLSCQKNSTLLVFVCLQCIKPDIINKTISFKLTIAHLDGFLVVELIHLVLK